MMIIMKKCGTMMKTKKKRNKFKNNKSYRICLIKLVHLYIIIFINIYLKIKNNKF